MKKFDVMICIRTDEKVRKSIKSLAKKLGLSKSEAIRFAVNSALAVTHSTDKNKKSFIKKK